jgi:hypothetical protein
MIGNSEIEKKLAPTWCFDHSSPIPCTECDIPCPHCHGHGETENSYGAGMAGGYPNCPKCQGSGLSGKNGKLIINPNSWQARNE